MSIRESIFPEVYSIDDMQVAPEVVPQLDPGVLSDTEPVASNVHHFDWHCSAVQVKSNLN